MNYNTFEVSINNCNGLTFIEITACDMQAAHADIREAFGADVEIVSTRVL